jgi:hypothetical protein
MFGCRIEQDDSEKLDKTGKIIPVNSPLITRERPSTIDAGSAANWQICFGATLRTSFSTACFWSDQLQKGSIRPEQGLK